MKAGLDNGFSCECRAEGGLQSEGDIFSSVTYSVLWHIRYARVCIKLGRSCEVEASRRWSLGFTKLFKEFDRQLNVHE